jgi:saccharopine dehydrogenase-like NADP-dependent oxidoreductase
MNKNFHIFGSGGIGQAAIVALESCFMGSFYHVYDIRFDDMNRYFTDLDENVKLRITQHNIDLSKTFVGEIDGDFVLDCTPGVFAPKVASLAMQNEMGYINLTEYVEETEIICDLAKSYSSAAVILQSGVAPGFVNIVGKKLIEKVQTEHPKSTLETLDMMVGALSDNARSPHFYAFTWSPIGVATEYLMPSNLVENHQELKVDSLAKISSHIIDGFSYESSHTSGGVADMAEIFASQIKNISYQTLRYPGHFQWVKDLIKNKKITDPKVLLSEMEKEVPFVEDDKIIIYTYLDYLNDNKKLQSVSKSYEVKPQTIFGVKLRAIQVATAIPMIVSVDWAMSFGKKGLVTQSMIDADFFLNHKLIVNIFLENGVELTETEKIY